MSEVPQQSSPWGSEPRCPVPCPTLVGCPCGDMPIGEILTQKRDEDPRILCNPSAQLGVGTTSDSTGSGDGSGDPRDCRAAAAQHLDQRVEETYGSQQTRGRELGGEQ